MNNINYLIQNLCIIINLIQYHLYYLYYNNCEIEKL